MPLESLRLVKRHPGVLCNQALEPPQLKVLLGRVFENNRLRPGAGRK